MPIPNSYKLAEELVYELKVVGKPLVVHIVAMLECRLISECGGLQQASNEGMGPAGNET